MIDVATLAPEARGGASPCIVGLGPLAAGALHKCAFLRPGRGHPRAPPVELSDAAPLIHPAQRPVPLSAHASSALPRPTERSALHEATAGAQPATQQPSMLPHRPQLGSAPVLRCGQSTSDGSHLGGSFAGAPQGSCSMALLTTCGAAYSVTRTDGSGLDWRSGWRAQARRAAAHGVVSYGASKMNQPLR